MQSEAKIIQFIGPPCSGKTTISKILFNQLKLRNLNVFYFEKRPDNYNNFYNFIDIIVYCFLFFSVLLFSLFFLKKITKIGFKNHLVWIRRLCDEWINSVICRRFLISIKNRYNVIIADHCLESMYLFEICDPRNVAGFKLWGIVNFFMKYFPLMKISNSFFIYADPSVLVSRLIYKNKIVRVGLSDIERNIFFIFSINLLNLIKNKLPMPYFSYKYEFIDTSFCPLEKTFYSIYEKILSDNKF